MNEAGKVSNFPWLRQRVYNPVVNFDRCEQLVPNKRLQLVAAYLGCRLSRPHPACITFNDQWFASVLRLYFDHDHHDQHHILINIIITIIADQCTRTWCAGECFLHEIRNTFLHRRRNTFFYRWRNAFLPRWRNIFLYRRKNTFYPVEEVLFYTVDFHPHNDLPLDIWPASENPRSWNLW